MLVGPGGTNAFFDTVNLGSNTTILVGQTVQWNWASGSNFHSTWSGNCSGSACTPDFIWQSLVENEPYSYTHTFNTPGTYGYFCSVHGVMMQGAVNVPPAGSPLARGKRAI